jgi:hypothetical protein
MLDSTEFVGVNGDRKSPAMTAFTWAETQPQAALQYPTPLHSECQRSYSYNHVKPCSIFARPLKPKCQKEIQPTLKIIAMAKRSATAKLLLNAVGSPTGMARSLQYERSEGAIPLLDSLGVIAAHVPSARPFTVSESPPTSPHCCSTSCPPVASCSSTYWQLSHFYLVCVWHGHGAS